MEGRHCHFRLFGRSCKPKEFPLSSKGASSSAIVISDYPADSYAFVQVLIVMMFGMTTMCSTFASSVFSPALPYISEEYGISREVSVLGISLFVLGYVFGPLLFAPCSELYGRKISILTPMFIFACFSAATATASNIQTIFITRFVSICSLSDPSHY